MTLTQDLDLDAGIGFANDISDLSIIQEKSCAIVSCDRKPDSSVLNWLEELDPIYLPKARVILPPERVQRALKQICDNSGTPDCEERDRFIADISDLAKAFTDIMHPPYIRLRLDVITTNACRKFHIDAIKSRLLCTYRGSGTQYGVSINGAEPSHIFNVPLGSPIVLRGTLWPESPKSGVVHRSPPIEGTGECRSVLVIDPIFDLEEES